MRRGRLVAADGDVHDAGRSRGGLLLLALRPNAAAVRQHPPQINPQLLNADRLVLAGVLMIGPSANSTISSLHLLQLLFEVVGLVGPILIGLDRPGGSVKEAREATKISPSKILFHMLIP